MQETKITFPKDESKHHTMTEWWYLNGHLVSSNGDEYSYMSTLFRVRYPAILGGPFKFLPSTDRYFYHSITTNIGTGAFSSKVEIVSVAPGSFRNNTLSTSFSGFKGKDNFQLIKKENDLYLATSPDFELHLQPTKTPLLVGQTGHVDNVGVETYYYSLTSLVTDGQIYLNDKKVEVTGKSWMDHQWGDFGAPKGYWNWFSVQLDSDIEIVCYESGGKNGRKSLATISFADGSQQSYSEIIIKPGKEYWTSPKTKARYALNWEISIPEIELSFKIRALVPDHELNFWYINYWEGPSNVSGKIADQKVTGKGFIELVGRHSKVRRHGPLASFFLGQLQRNKYK